MYRIVVKSVGTVRVVISETLSLFVGVVLFEAQLHSKVPRTEGAPRTRTYTGRRAAAAAPARHRPRITQYYTLRAHACVHTLRTRARAHARTIWEGFASCGEYRMHLC